MTIEEIQKEVCVMQSEEDIKRLIDFVKRIRSPNIYLEIGCSEGGSVAIAALSNPNIEAYSIDIKNLESRQKLYSKLEYKYHFIHKSSIQAYKEWNGKSIGLLMIDGAHYFENIITDFVLWSQYLAQGGIVFFHDYTARIKEWKEVKEAVDILMTDPRYKILEKNKSHLLITKKI